MTDIFVKVRPDSKKFKIIDNTILTIHLESSAENNKANTELIKELEVRTNQSVGIISGHKSRRKKLRIESGKEEFKKLLLND